jgi:uncharacterized protein YndB with AHSA1/START domain
VFTWQPASDEQNPTEVEVRFIPTQEGTTVELEHRDWDRLGERAGAARDGYDGGWVEVLAAFAAAAA